MKKIKLSQNMFALVDDSDFEFLNKFKWHYRDGYARRNIYLNGKQSTWLIYWSVVGKPPRGLTVDHINGNTLDNRRENLRVCTRSENQRNRGKIKNSTSGFKGVSWHKNVGKWQASIGIAGIMKYLGLFTNPEEAHKAYCKANK